MSNDRLTTSGVGLFRGMFSDARQRLLAELEDVSPQELDAVPAGSPNSIGTLLYHVAAIELDYTFADLLGLDSSAWPAAAWEWFSVDVRDDDGVLNVVVEPLPRHLDRLEWVRGQLFTALESVGDADLDTAPGPGGYQVAWVLHHLLQHEAEHRGQIGEIKAALRM